MAATWRLGTASMVLATVWTMAGRVAEAQLAPLTLPLAVHDYAALPRPVPWGYLLRPSLVASVVAASSIAGAAAQSGMAVTAKAPRVDRWPCRIVAASTLREAFEQGWERSKTIRGQCEELAGARAVVALEWVVATDSLSLAKTAMAVRGGVVAATVRIPPVGETIVLLAHELQHVIEKARGLDLEAEAKRPDSGVWKAAGGYETQGAIAVSRQVAAELRVVAIGPTTSGRTDEVGPSKGRQSATSIQPPTGGHLVGFTSFTVRFWLRSAIQDAARRLRRPECRRVLSDFTDASGNLLETTLIRFTVDPATYLLEFVWFVDGSAKTQCRGNTAAFTQPGSRVVFVCGGYFEESSRLGRAELVIIHEILHSLGLGENPPSSDEIAKQVLTRCGGDNSRRP